MTAESDAEQFLTDLEAKAKAATPGPWQPGKIMDIGTVRQANGDILADCRLQYDGSVKNSKFIAAAYPAAVLRLVAMVRWMTDVLHHSTGRINDKKYDVSKAPWLITAYNATETRHD